jgi:hypothetical protein
MIDYPYQWEPNAKLSLAQSLFYMEGNTESNFKLFIVAELLRLDQENRKDTNAVTFNQRQGACQVLADLLDLMAGANEMHKTLKRAEPINNQFETYKLPSDKFM